MRISWLSWGGCLRDGLLTLMLLLGWNAVGAQTLTPIHVVEGISEYRLPNGLQVLLIPDDSKPTTTVNVTYHVGSRYENYGETGMAHLLEHLMFKGSPKHPQVWAEFNKRGLRANGTTWYDRTNYFASFAANDDNLQWYLAWQADAMVNSFIARRDLDSEMTVVRNEMEMGENSPNRMLLEKTVSAMYQWHNYGKSTIGARIDVEQVDIAHLQAFYHRYYQPDNATLIVAGRFDTAKVLDWVQADFGVIPRPTRELPTLYTLDPTQDGEHAVTVRRVGGTPLLYAAYHVPAAAAPDYAAIEVLELIFGDTPSGRLHRGLVEQQLAASVFGFSEGLADPGFAIFGAQLSLGQDVDAARQALLKTMESTASEPITAAELRRAQAKWLKDWDEEFADPQHVGVAISEAVAQGDWRLFFLLRDRVKNLQLSDVQRVAQAYLLRSNRTLGTYLPEDHPERAPAPQRVDAHAQVENYQGQAGLGVTQAFETTPANLDAHTLISNVAPGLKVALLPKPTRGQTVQAVLVLHFGDEKTLAGWGSTPEMVAALLDRGTSKLSRQDIQDQLDALRSQVTFAPILGGVRVTISSKREFLAPTITLLGTLLRDSVMTTPMLEELRHLSLASLQEGRREPQALVDNALARHGNPYPRGDVRYARTFDEIEQDLRALNLEKAQQFYHRFYGADDGEFAAVGDFPVESVRLALSAAFANWSSQVPYVRVPTPRLAQSADRLVLITPDKQNAVLSMQQSIALKELDPQAPALMLANYMLGAGGDSRLWNRIREKQGLSYNVYSAIKWNPLEDNSSWLAAAIFAPQNLSKVETSMNEEIARAREQGFTAAELAVAQRSLLSFRRLSRAQDQRLADTLQQNLFLGRTFAQAEQLDHELETTTLQAVNLAFKTFILPEQIVTVIGGDIKALDHPPGPSNTPALANSPAPANLPAPATAPVRAPAHR